MLEMPLFFGCTNQGLFSFKEKGSAPPGNTGTEPLVLIEFKLKVKGVDLNLRQQQHQHLQAPGCKLSLSQ